MADQTGIWIGSREDWEREVPLVVDRVPVVRVWVLNMAPLPDGDGWKWSTVSPTRHPEDVPYSWVKGAHDFPFPLFATAAEAQAWLTQIALEYARRVRAEKEKKDE